MSHKADISRRSFLKSTAFSVVGSLVKISSNSVSARDESANDTRQRIAGWEYHARSLGGIWEVWRGDKAGNNADARLWHPVQLPHCFNALDALDLDEPYYQGPGWYRTRLRLANPFPNGRTLLHFEGAGQKSAVFVYLDQAGQHTGGYDEFMVDITDAASKFLTSHKTDPEVPIAVLCDNSPDLEMIPSALSDFNRYGGLYRHVNLIYVPAVSLQRIHVTPAVQPGQPATVSVKSRLYNPTRLKDDLQISINVFDPKGAKVYSALQRLAPWEGEREIATCNVEAPELWSPSQPALYRCEALLTSSLGTMSVTEKFGFRSFEFVRHGPFKLNGERLLLQGTHRHEDHALLGNAMPDELIRREIELIKAMGANFIRLGHYQQSRNVLELCDELGLLVWEEIPWCRGGLGGEGYKQQARNMLGAMIDQHYNHPSIIIWGLGNENDWPGDFPEFDAGKIRAFAKELNDQAHALDPSRKTAMRRCDFCKDIADVYSPSVWTGWFYGHYTDYKDPLQKELEKVDHFLHIEWGAESYARRHSEDADRLLLKAISGGGLDAIFSGQQGPPSRNGDWSETYTCSLFDWCLKEQETMPWLTGSAQWAFKDFSTPLRSNNPIPYMNLKGLVERDLTPKEGYYVFQSYWAQKPMVHIFGHSWPVRWGERDELKLVKVYSNCESAELFLNGVSLGAKKRNSQDFPAAGFHWTANFKAGENSLRAVGRKAGATVSDEIHLQYQTEKWDKPARLELREIERHGDTVKIEARLVDAKGVLCLDARNLVRFGSTGAGLLLDHAGTSTASNSLELYCGRAEISLHRNGGRSVVSVSAKLFDSAFLSVM